MLNVLLSLGVFASILLFMEGAQAALTSVLSPDRQRFRRRLRSANAQENESSLLIVKKALLMNFPWLNDLMERIPILSLLQLLPEQAGLRMSAGKLLSLSLSFGAAGVFASLIMNGGALVTFCVTLGGLLAPFLYALEKRRKRFQKFELQFPNAMDLIARCLRAGHPFLGGLRIVSEEMEDPVGTEFRKVVEEITFGIETETALKSLVTRINLMDLKFFVTAAIIQRETGGNLAEIVEAISEVIRQRFAMQSRTKSLSAEGKLSAGVLLAMPFAMLLALSILNPNYIRPLFVDPTGIHMLQGGGLLMIVGALVMKKLIKIKI
jgi:tight adherence protein B